MFSQHVRDNCEGAWRIKPAGCFLPDIVQICEGISLVLDLKVFITVCIVMVEAGKAAALAVRDVGLRLVRLLRPLLAARVAYSIRGVLRLALVAVRVDHRIYVPLGGHSP